MPALNYTAAELASLAPEERSALEAASGADQAELEEIAGGAEAEPDAGAAATAAAAGDAAATETAAAAAPSAEGTQSAAAPAASPAVAPAAAAPAAAPTPAPAPNAVVYRADVGDVAKDIQAQKDEIKTARGEKRAALMKLNDGEIDAEEYAKIEDAADAKIDSANDKILELNRAQARVEVSVELTAQQQQNAWKGMLNTYVADAKKDGIDYTADEAKRGEFNSLLKAFAQEASDKGMSDDNNMAASRWALEQAASIMGVRYPKAAAAPAAGAPAQAAAPAAGAPAAAPAAAALGGLQTLGKMPAAAAAPVADDVMTKINTLEGEELELYMASLPRDVYNRVTAGAQ